MNFSALSLHEFFAALYYYIIIGKKGLWSSHCVKQSVNFFIELTNKILSQNYQPVQHKQHIFLVGRFPVPMDLGHPGTLNIQHFTDVKAGDALICFMYGVKEYHTSYVIFCKFKWSKDLFTQ